MAELRNKHYVPQYYFRNFSNSGNAIGTVRIKDGMVIPAVSIKEECAQDNFYGSNEMERAVSRVEGIHSAALRTAIKAANEQSFDDLTVEWWTWFCEAITFQQGRTAQEAERTAVFIEKFYMAAFTHLFQYSNEHNLAEEARKALDAGEVAFVQDRCPEVLRSALSKAAMSPFIMDFKCCFLINKTDYPFIFSDSPIVLYNQHCLRVRNRGVLGLLNPGL